MKCGKCNMEYRRQTMIEVQRIESFRVEGIQRQMVEKKLLCQGCQTHITDNYITFNGKTYTDRKEQ